MSRKPKSKLPPTDLDEDSFSNLSKADSYQNALSDDNNEFSDADSLMKSILPPELLKKVGKFPSSKGSNSKRKFDQLSFSSFGSDINPDNAKSNTKSSASKARTRKTSQNSLEDILAGLSDDDDDNPPTDRRSAARGSADVAGSSKSHGQPFGQESKKSKRVTAGQEKSSSVSSKWAHNLPPMPPSPTISLSPSIPSSPPSHRQTWGQESSRVRDSTSAYSKSGRHQTTQMAENRSCASVRFAPDTNLGVENEELDFNDSELDNLPQFPGAANKLNRSDRASVQQQQDRLDKPQRPQRQPDHRQPSMMRSQRQSEHGQQMMMQPQRQSENGQQMMMQPQRQSEHGQQMMMQPQRQSEHGQQMIMQSQRQSQQQPSGQFSFEMPNMDSESSQNPAPMSDEHIAKLKDWGQRIRQCIFQSNMAIKEKETEIATKNSTIRTLQEENAKLKRDSELTNIGYQSEKDGRTSIEKRINGLHHLCVGLKDSAVSMDSVVKAVKSAFGNSKLIVEKYQASLKSVAASLVELEKNLADSKAIWREKFRQQQETSAADAASAQALYDKLNSEMAEKVAMLEQCQAALTQAEASCESFQHRNKDLEDSLVETRAEKQSLEAELDATKQKLQSTSEVSAQLQDALTDLGEKRDSLAAQVSALSQAKAAVESELSDAMVAHQGQVAELERQLMECRLETDELKNNIIALNHDLDEANCSLAETSDNLSTMESEVARQARELSSANLERDELKAQIETIELAKAECESLLLAASAENDRMKDKMLADEELTDSLKAQLAEMSGLMQEARTETDEKARLLNQRDELNNMLQDEIQQLKDDKASISERIIDMECELASLKFDSNEKLHQLELNICDLEQQLSEKISEASRLSERTASLAAARDEATRQLAESAATVESVSAALSRREAELRATESRVAEAVARADGLQTGEMPRLRAALTDAEARADKAEKSAASLAQELAAVGAAVREKDARLDDLRQELGGLRDAMALGSASMKSEFAAMLERLCEEKDRQLADREDELANLKERSRQAASTKPKTPVAAIAATVVIDDSADENADQHQRSSPTHRSPKSLPPTKPMASTSPLMRQSTPRSPQTPAAVTAASLRTPKSTTANVSAGRSQSATSTPPPERQLNVKSPRSIMRRQEPSVKRRKVHFNERDNAIELRSADSPAEATVRSTAKHLVLSPPQASPNSRRATTAKVAAPAEDEDSNDGFWFDSDLIFSQKNKA